MTNAIEVEDVHKVYRGKNGELVRALDGVSFHVSRGPHLRSAWTKRRRQVNTRKDPQHDYSTHFRPRAVMGCDVTRQPQAVREQLSVVLQQTATENLLTVRDNLLIYAYLHGVKSAVAQQRLRAVVDEFELGERLRDTVQELSLGTKRRIQVAKIFMLEAPLIILDEATTGMDPLMKRRVMDRLRTEARNGRTILLTTQVLSEAEELCESIMIIDHGRAMASGTLRELRTLSTRMFRVNLVFGGTDGDLVSKLEALKPAKLQVDGNNAELVFHGEEEATLLGKLAEISRDNPILQFEVRGPTLEEVFIALMQETR